MDFFEHQDQSRRKSRWLVLMFLVATAAIVVAVDVVVVALFGVARDEGLRTALAANVELVTAASALTAVAILGGSAFRIAQLGSGGADVAKALGGVPVPPEAADLPRRRLRNVVEETALASGLPVPEVFLLEQESAINAFAAGNSPSDAAIAVTRGALEGLSRDELQGVIAHEFSHIGNGDMRLNLRLMGWLFGILLLALVGRGMLRAGARGGRGRGSGGMVLFGLALVVVGYIGVFAGRIIKAAVSRERERLADASAVQFTRNPPGLAGALKKIGGLSAGSRLQEAEAEEVSHMLFAKGLSGFFDTHPPLVERIRALEPGFDPAEFERVKAAPDLEEEPAPTPAPEAGQGLAGGSITPALLLAAAGQPGPEALAAGHALHRAIPDDLKKAARTEDGARAVVAALVMSDEPSVRDEQRAVVRRWLDEHAAQRAADLGDSVQALAAPLRLPLFEMAWPALRHLSPQALADLRRAVRELVEADGRVTVFEFALARLLLVQIRELGSSGEPSRVRLRNCHVELGDLFAVMARAGQPGETAARRAYEAGLAGLLPRDRPGYRPPEDWRAALHRALDRLDGLPSVIKRELVEALGTTCAHDGRLDPEQADLLRTVAASLHCPMPPLPLDRGDG